MAEFTESVANEKIKIRWDETYTSEGLNRKTAIFPPGLYEGGDVDYADANTLRINGGTFVTRDTVNGFGLLLRDPDVVTIDCSSLFPATATQDWYVGIRISYSSGNPTTGEYFFTDIVPSAAALVGKDDFVFFKVTIHNTDTGLDFATFESLGSAPPTPYPLRATAGSVLSTDRNYGLLSNVQAYGLPSSDEKDALAGYPGTTDPDSSNKFMTQEYLTGAIAVRVRELYSISGQRFQLSGNVFVGTESVTDERYFLLLYTTESRGGERRVLSSDSSLIYISEMRTSDDSSTLNPSVHADADGFYTNPWVTVSASGGTVPDISVDVMFTKKMTIADMSTQLDSIPRAAADIWAHAEMSHVKAAGTPSAEPYDRWTIGSGNTIQEGIEALLEAVNETRIDQRIMSGTWLLSYRSGGIAADSGVTDETISHYVNEDGYLIVHGAYLDPGDGYIKTASSVSGRVSVFGTYRGYFFVATASGVLSSTALTQPYSIAFWSLRTESDPWDIITRWGEGGELEYFNDDGEFVLWNTIVNHKPILSTDEVLLDSYQTYDQGVQVISPNKDRAWLTSNASWDSSTEEFDLKNVSYDALGIGMNPGVTENVLGFYIHDTSIEAEPWGEDEWLAMGGFWRYYGSNDKIGGMFLNGMQQTITNGNAQLIIFTEPVYGLFLIKAENAGEFALYALVGASTPTLVFGNAAYWGTTSGGSQVNLYYSSGIRLQNTSGITEDFTFGAIDMMDRKVL